MERFQSERTSEAFERLYAAAAPDLMGWIERFVATRRFHVDPFEILHDTFVNVYRYAGSFRVTAPGGFQAWARTIAGNVVRRARTRSRVAGTLFIDGDGAERALVDRGRTPAGRAEDVETAERLRAEYTLLLAHYAAAFETLKARDRAALHMVEVERLDYAEVGRRLGTARSNTKMIVFRARRRLFAALQASLGAADALSRGASAAAPDGGARAA